MKILLCGNNSFAARGLYEKLLAAGVDVECFSRGVFGKRGNIITGNVFEMTPNTHLAKTYDIVINFIIIKDEGVEENIRYIEELDKFCSSRGVKRLVQISSISVYPNEVPYVNEQTEIEDNLIKKGEYAAVKLAVDQYFLKKKLGYKVIFVRPGFIVSSNQELSLAGIGIALPLKSLLLLGNNKTTLPLIEKETLQEAIIRIVQEQNPQPVYLLLENLQGTKYQYLKDRVNCAIITLPKNLVLMAASMAQKLKVLPERKYYQIQGLFKSTYFDSSSSESALNLTFTKNSICVIGAGAYGSYTINALSEKYPESKITLLDVGDENIKSEEEIGYKSNILKSAYTGLSNGRFFGFGGATAKWGGQLLSFSKNDFITPNQYLSDIVELNEKYKSTIFDRFGIKNDFPENKQGNNLFTKTGVWLGYFSRNLFKYFDISKRKNVHIIKQARLIRIHHKQKKVTGIEYFQNGKIKRGTFDHYFLTAGAFESNRLLLKAGILNDGKCSFSDHLSQKVFKIKNSTKIGDEDYAFRIKGTSLITKRLIGEIDGVSFFANPIYNSEFPFFQNLKRILFKREISLSVIKATLADLPSVFAFVWSMVVKRKIYAYKKEWYLYIDIENPTTSSYISLSSDNDRFGEPALDVTFTLGERAGDIYQKAKEIVKEHLQSNQVSFEDCSDIIHVEKSEDTYHPYAMLSDFNSIQEYFTFIENMIIVNTGVLPRAGGINTTAVGFALIEEYVNNHLKMHHE